MHVGDYPAGLNKEIKEEFVAKTANYNKQDSVRLLKNELENDDQKLISFFKATVKDTEYINTHKELTGWLFDKINEKCGSHTLSEHQLNKIFKAVRSNPQLLGRLLEDNCILEVADSKIPVNRLLFASQSDYLKALLLGSFEESTKEVVKLRDVHPGAVAIVVEYLKTGKIKSFVRSEVLMETIIVADMWNLLSLKPILEEMLINDLTPERARQYSDYAHQNDLSVIHELLTKYALTTLHSCLSNILKHETPEVINILGEDAAFWQNEITVKQREKEPLISPSEQRERQKPVPHRLVQGFTSYVSIWFSKKPLDVSLRAIRDYTIIQNLLPVLAALPSFPKEDIQAFSGDELIFLVRCFGDRIDHLSLSLGFDSSMLSEIALYARSINSLKSVDLSDTRLNNEQIETFLESPSSWKKISLANARNSEPDQKWDALAKVHDLESLNLENCNDGFKYLPEILKQSPDLKELNIAGYEGDINEVVQDCVRYCPHIHALNLDQTSLDTQGLDFLGTPKRPNMTITSLSLEGIGLSPEDLRSLPLRFPNLRDLNLSSCLVDEGVCKELSKLHHLESIKLDNCRALNDAGIEAIASGCPNLVSISLSSADIRTTRNFTDRSIAALAKLRHLKSVSLHNYSSITGEAMAYFVKNHKTPLEIIRLGNCPKVHDRFVEALASTQSNLKIIELSNPNFGDKNLKKLIRRQSGLAELNLSGTKVKGSTVIDDVLCNPAFASSLEILDLSSCEAVNNHYSVVGLDSIKVKNLKSLSVNETSLESTPNIIRANPHLKAISLCGFRDQNELIDALSDLSISSPSYLHTLNLNRAEIGGLFEKAEEQVEEWEEVLGDFTNLRYLGLEIDFVSSRKRIRANQIVKGKNITLLT